MMKSITILVLLVSLHGVTSWSFWRREEKPRPLTKCVPPSRFEGKMHGVFKRKHPLGFTEQALGSGTMHMDTTTGRAVMIGDFYVYGQVKKMNAFMTPSTLYLAVPKAGQCMQEDMDTPILPHHTTKITERHQGGVPVQIWEADLEEDGKQGHIKIYLTQDTCMPVSVDLDVTTASESLSATFSDMKEGLRDESVLDVPSYCHTVFRYRGRRDLFSQVI